MSYSVGSINKCIIFTIKNIKSTSLFLEFVDLNIGKIGRSFIAHNIKDESGTYSTLIIEFEKLYDDSWSKNKYNNFIGLFGSLNLKLMCNIVIPKYLSNSKNKSEHTFIAASINDFNVIVKKNLSYINTINNSNQIQLEQIINNVRSKILPNTFSKKIVQFIDDELWGY